VCVGSLYSSIGWLEAVSTYKLPVHVIIGVRFVTRSIAFIKCGIHVPH